MFEARGWTVLRIWECELTPKKKNELIKKLEFLTKRENRSDFFGKDVDK